MSYKKIADLGCDYSFSNSTMYRLVKEMADSGRYPKTAVVGSGRMRRVDSDAFLDFVSNRDILRHPNMRRYLKPYKEGKS